MIKGLFKWRWGTPGSIRSILILNKMFFGGCSFVVVVVVVVVLLFVLDRGIFV